MDGGLDWIPTQSDIEENGMLLFYDPTEVINLPKDEQKHEENKEESIDNKNEDQNSPNEVEKEIDVNEEEKENLTSPPCILHLIGLFGTIRVIAKLTKV